MTHAQRAAVRPGYAIPAAAAALVAMLAIVAAIALGQLMPALQITPANETELAPAAGTDIRGELHSEYLIELLGSDPEPTRFGPPGR